MVRRLSIANAVSIIGMGIVCLPVFLMLFPNIEMSRSEARLSMAFDEARRLHQTLADEENSESVTTLSDLDPWEQPYRLVQLDGHQVRVLSSGPNMSFSPTGIEDDDIYSDMPISPIEPIIAQKRWRCFFALAASVGCWVLLAALYLWWQR